MTTKAELDSKHLAELHELAADAGVERYRMLTRTELIETLAGGAEAAAAAPAPAKRERRPRRRPEPAPESPPEPESESSPEPDEPASEPEAKSMPAAAGQSAPEPEQPKRRRRRRRWGRRRKGVRVQDLLLPATGGRAIVYAESREACTALLREVAAELSGASEGPDPIALLIDPTPEELAEWKRDAPEAEIVSAGKAKHADDALAQASSRAAGGEAVIVLIDSLSRYAEELGDADGARGLFTAGDGSLTVVAALERAD